MPQALANDQHPPVLHDVFLGQEPARRQLGDVKKHFVEQSWELTQRSVAYLKTLEI